MQEQTLGTSLSIVALIPARAGSQRVPNKNVRSLAGHPLLAYSIAAAAESSIFDSVVVSTDSDEIARIARHYGAETPELRPPELATSTSPDIEWVRHMLSVLTAAGRRFDAFSIVRPTSPFRGAEAFRRALETFLREPAEVDSVRAVELCKQHPGKMWTLVDGYLEPLLPQPAGTPFHSQQYAALPPVYVQNSSLEIAWVRVVEEMDSIAGERVRPFFTEGLEGFSIDYPEDWERAEAAAELGHLPNIPIAAWDENGRRSA